MLQAAKSHSLTSDPSILRSFPIKESGGMKIHEKGETIMRILFWIALTLGATPQVARAKLSSGSPVLEMSGKRVECSNFLDVNKEGFSVSSSTSSLEGDEVLVSVHSKIMRCVFLNKDSWDVHWMPRSWTNDEGASQTLVAAQRGWFEFEPYFPVEVSENETFERVYTYRVGLDEFEQEDGSLTIQLTFLLATPKRISSGEVEEYTYSRNGFTLELRPKFLLASPPPHQ